MFPQALEVPTPIQHHHIHAQQYLLPRIIGTVKPFSPLSMVDIDRVDHILAFKNLSLMVDGSCLPA